MKFIRKTKGAISIFLALIILPMYTCAGLIVDGSRVYAARTAVSGAGDLTMNAALSEYENILQDVYGLFAISETTEDLQKNVERYFNNTINNTGVLEGSDSYTRSFINSIGSMFSTEEISFNNIVDTEVEKFSLVEVPDSALANPTIMERQIIEYMKYRGPVSIGRGLLTKIGCIGETSKQTEVINKKVSYEKKLDEVEDACETAYNAIVSYNNTLDTSQYKDESYLTALKKDAEEAKSYSSQMVSYILAVKASDLSVNTMSIDSEIKKSVAKSLKEEVSEESENPELEKYEKIKEKIKALGLEIVSDSNGEYTLTAESILKWMKYMSIPQNDLNAQMQHVIKVKADYETFREMITYLEVYINCYDMLSESEKESYKEEFEKYSEVQGMIFSQVAAAQEFQFMEWKNKANECGRNASGELYKWYKELETLDTNLQDAIDALDALKGKVGTLSDSRTEWKNSIDDLSNSDIKTSMKGDYENSAKQLNETVVNDLKDLLEGYQTKLSKIKTDLESIKINGVNICRESNSSTDYIAMFSSFPSIKSSEINGKTSSIMNSYASPNFSDENYSGIKKVTTDNQFFKYLESIFGNTKTEAEETAKDIAKNNRKELIKQGNGEEKDEEGNTTDGDTRKADMTGITTGSYEEKMTTEIATAIEALANTSSDNPTFSPSKVDSSEDSNKKLAEQNQANLTQVTNLLSSLGDIAENARDKVYLEEYFTEMFSCYTSGMALDGKSQVAPMSLSNENMSSNVFYRSEVEYILWGNDSVETNLNNTKAMIFAIRFALNSIFAFTDSYTRTPALTAATAIAGWTGFGVPIVQTVILLAWAMAESIVDINNLCNGQAVCIYKSDSTWVLGINGAIQVGKDIVSNVVDDVFEQIEGLATDSIDSANTYVENYVEQTSDEIVDSVKETIVTAVETQMTQILGETYNNLSKETVGKRIDDMLTGISNSATGDGTTQTAIRAAISTMKSSTVKIEGKTIRDYIVDTIFSAYQDAKNGLHTALSQKVEELLTKIVAPIENSIKSTVSSVGQKLKDEVKRITEEGGEKAKEKINDAIDGYIGKIGGTGTKSNLTASKTLTLTYKEYLKIFTLLFMIPEGNEQAMLSRCAKLIQINVAAQESSFDISKAYTLVEVNATVSVGTTFFDIPVTTRVDVNGNPTYDLEFSNLGSGRQSIKYVGILGY